LGGVDKNVLLCEICDEMIEERLRLRTQPKTEEKEEETEEYDRFCQEEMTPEEDEDEHMFDKRCREEFPKWKATANCRCEECGDCVDTTSKCLHEKVCACEEESEEEEEADDNGNPHCDDCDKWSMTTGHRCWTPDGEHMYCEGCAEAHGDEFEEEEEEEDTITEDTIVAGIVCRACSHALPPMTVKQHLNGEFNKTCPHTA
jgi:hypothetical protein